MVAHDFFLPRAASPGRYLSVQKSVRLRRCSTARAAEKSTLPKRLSAPVAPSLQRFSQARHARVFMPRRARATRCDEPSQAASLHDWQNRNALIRLDKIFHRDFFAPDFGAPGRANRASRGAKNCATGLAKKHQRACETARQPAPRHARHVPKNACDDTVDRCRKTPAPSRASALPAINRHSF